MDLKFVLILVSMATFSQGLKCYEGGLIHDQSSSPSVDTMYNAGTMKEKECWENQVCFKRM